MKLATCVLLVVARFLTAAGAAVSTEPPEWYAEVLGDKLTPFDQVEQDPPAQLIKDEPGVILLSETITRVRADGGQDVLTHYVYRPLTEQGVKQVQEERFDYSAERQKMHLIRARTIAPDGRVSEASADGIFVQRPEGDRASAIYDDREDLVVIFSEVRVGCVIEVVALREDVEPRVEGEASGVLTWNPVGWPVVRGRKVVGVAEAMRERFQTVTLGKGAPVPEISTSRGLTWHDAAVTNLASRDYEVNQAPPSQVGPATWYSTFRTWEQVGRWYGRLVEPQGKLNDELKAEVAKAVGDRRKPREVLDALFPLAARDIRYTGLEFGHSGILPYSCNQVWERKYGDCKDQSTLLVSMLRSRGIEAWVGLVNTLGEGLIPREAPGTRAFNHAIVIVDVDPGEGERLLFCDPTIAYGRPGLLAPSSADREVLLASAAGGRLVRSPKADAGSQAYRFELEMDESGRLSGWMTWESSGYYAVSTAVTYDGLDRARMRNGLTNRVKGFFPSAEVADFEVVGGLKPGLDKAVLKVFFTTAAQERGEDGTFPVTFPASGGLLMNYGDRPTRESTYFQWRDEIAMTMGLKVAPGLVPVMLPRPLEARSPGYAIAARWEFEPTRLTAALEVGCRKSLLSPDDVLAARQASRAWARWSGQPLLLKPGADWEPPAPTAEIRLPLMPTGEGQLALVERWYPLGQGAERRKRALEKVLQLFPTDPATLYGARLELAALPYYADRYDEAIPAYQKLAARHPSGVSAESHALAHYMLGLCFFETGQFAKADEAFEKAGAVEGISPYRQGWALTGRGKCLQRMGQGPEAIALFREAEKIEADHRPELLRNFLHAHLKGDEVAAAVETWKRFEALLGEDALGVVEQLGREPADPLLAAGAQLEAFFQALKNEVGEEEAERLASLLSDFSYEREKIGRARELREKLLTVVEGKFPDYLSRDLHPALANQAAYLGKLADLYATDSVGWLRHAYGYLKRFEADERFTTFFWHFLVHLEWRENSLPVEQRVLMEDLIPLVDLVPRQDDNYWESRFTVAEWYQDQGRWARAEKILEDLRHHRLLPEDFRAAALRRHGISLEFLGRWEDAVKAHLERKDDRMEASRACEQLMRAGWILARLGRLDEALATWQLLREVPETLYQEELNAGLIAEAALLAGTPEKTKGYWKKTRSWWHDALQDYLRGIELELANDPPLSDQVQELKVVALAGRETSTISRDELEAAITVVLSGARWFPSFTSRIQDLFENYLRPVAKLRNEEFRRVALALLKTVSVGSDETRMTAAAQGHFYKVVLEEADALAHGYRLLEEFPEERWAAAREITLRRLGFAAIRDGEDLEKVEGLMREEWQARGREAGSVNLGVGIAQVLEARGKIEEAIAFTRAMLALPMISGNPQAVAAVEGFLKPLEEGSREKRAFLGQLEKWQERQDFGWLSYVKPQKLGEDRFEDPGQFLTLTFEDRHPLEVYRWGTLLLKSDLLEPDQRGEIFAVLMEFHLRRCRTFTEVDRMGDEILANDELPREMRLNQLWSMAVDVAFKRADEKRLGELVSHPLAQDLVEDLRVQGFADLKAVAKAKNAGKEAQLAQLEVLKKREELNAVGFGCAYDLAESIMSFCDPEANERVVELLRELPVTGMEKREVRLSLLRYRRMAADFREQFSAFFQFRESFRDKLVELGRKAPENWRDLRPGNVSVKLADDEKAGWHARIVLTREMGPDMTRAAIFLAPHLVVSEDGKLDEVNWKRFLAFLESVDNEGLQAVLYGAATTSSDHDPGLRKTMLERGRAWIESKNLRHLQQTQAVLEFDRGLTSPSEEELRKLVRDVAGHQGPRQLVEGLPLLKMLLSRKEKEALRVMLEGLPEELVYEGDFSIEALQGFRELGGDLEVELLQEELRASLSDFWMNAWNEKRVGEFQKAVSAYWVIGEERGGEVPEWMREIPKTMVLEIERVRCELLLLMTQGKWRKFEKLVRQHLDALQDAEGRVLLACADLGLGETGARERAQKVLNSPDKRDSYAIQLREMLRTEGEEEKREESGPGVEGR